MINIWSFLAGTVISYLFIVYRMKTSALQSSINDTISDIERFSERAEAYWLKSYDAKEDKERAAYVRISMFRLVISYEATCNACANYRDQYEKLMPELFNVATGGQFETSKRKLCQDTAQSIEEKSSELIFLLRKVRASSFTISYILCKQIGPMRD